MLDLALLAEGEYVEPSGKTAAGPLLAVGATAVFAGNDAMAAGFVTAAR